MKNHVMHGIPEGLPDAEPLRLVIDPGSASAEEIAKLLSAISRLSLLACGRQIDWKHVCCEEESPTSKVDLTPFEALDKVKALRAAWEACNGSLYKNVAVGVVQDFLEECIAKWGHKFMDCVEYEVSEERSSPGWMDRYGNDKGRREIVFGD